MFGELLQNLRIFFNQHFGVAQYLIRHFGDFPDIESNKLCAPSHRKRSRWQSHLRCHIDTLYDLVREGKISYVKMGRKIMFRPEAIQEFLNKKEVPAR